MTKSGLIFSVALFMSMMAGVEARKERSSESRVEGTYEERHAKYMEAKAQSGEAPLTKENRGGRIGVPSGLEAEEGEEFPKFLTWSSIYGRNYASKEELDRIQANWIEANRIIKEHNEKSAKSGKPNPSYLDHNKNSGDNHAEKDLEDAVLDIEGEFEWEEEPTGEAADQQIKASMQRRGRRLQTYDPVADEAIMWSETYTGPPPNKGSAICKNGGAIFAMATTIESRIQELKEFEGGTPAWQEISKQHLIDCTYMDNAATISAANSIPTNFIKNKGCSNKGNTKATADFVEEFGFYWEEDYDAYTDGTEGTCDHDPNDVV